MAKTKLLLTLLVMLCLFSTVKAQVSGIVFRDYNGNGTRQSGAGYTEPLAQGVVVTAYNAAEQTLATTTTNASGAYAFTALQIPSGTADVYKRQPYYHDGSALTLEEVILGYEQGGRIVKNGPFAGDGRINPFKSPLVSGFSLTDTERRDLISFLYSLSDSVLINNKNYANPYR